MTILLIAFLGIAAVARDRTWPLAPRPRQIAGFVGIGIVLTVVAEVVATEILRWWTYGDAMPVRRSLVAGRADARVI